MNGTIKLISRLRTELARWVFKDLDRKIVLIVFFES